MHKIICIFCALFTFTASASAATFSYDLILTSVTGDGGPQGVGFFGSASVGETGTGGVIIDETETDFNFALQDAFFSAQIGGGTAGSFFQKTFAQDSSTGTVTISGQLGGLTGIFPGYFISAGAYEFVYTSTPGFLPITSAADLTMFLSGASMSGFFSGAFVSLADDNIGFNQTVSFEGSTAPIPLPAGMVLLLSGLGALGLMRRRQLLPLRA